MLAQESLEVVFARGSNWKLGSLSVYCLSVEETRISPPSAWAAIRAARTTLRPRSSSDSAIT